MDDEHDKGDEGHDDEGGGEGDEGNNEGNGNNDEGDDEGDDKAARPRGRTTAPPRYAPPCRPHLPSRTPNSPAIAVMCLSTLVVPSIDLLQSCIVVEPEYGLSWMSKAASTC